MLDCRRCWRPIGRIVSWGSVSLGCDGDEEEIAKLGRGEVGDPNDGDEVGLALDNGLSELETRRNIRLVGCSSSCKDYRTNARVSIKKNLLE